MNIKVLTISVLMMTLLTGACTIREYYWVHQTKSSAQFYQESNQCMARAYQLFPKNFTSGKFVFDQNLQQRSRYYDSCLKGSGWYETYRNVRYTLY